MRVKRKKQRKTVNTLITHLTFLINPSQSLRAPRGRLRQGIIYFPYYTANYVPRTISRTRLVQEVNIARTNRTRLRVFNKPRAI